MDNSMSNSVSDKSTKTNTNDCMWRLDGTRLGSSVVQCVRRVSGRCVGVASDRSTATALNTKYHQNVITSSVHRGTGSRALRRCYFIGGGAPVDLGRRRRRAPARRPRLIGGGVAGKHRRRRRLVINYWKLATTNNEQCTIRLSNILYCGIYTFKRKQTTNECYYYCSQHFRLNFVGPIFI